MFILQTRQLQNDGTFFLTHSVYVHDPLNSCLGYWGDNANILFSSARLRELGCRWVSLPGFWGMGHVLYLFYIYGNRLWNVFVCMIYNSVYDSVYFTACMIQWNLVIKRSAIKQPYNIQQGNFADSSSLYFIVF